MIAECDHQNATSVRSPDGRAKHIRRLPAKGTRSLTSDCVTLADAGKQIPERVEHAIDRGFDGRSILVSDVLLQHFTLGGGVFAIGFNVDAEVVVALRIIEAVVFFQTIDLRFRNGRDLAFSGVERTESICGRASGAGGTEGIDQRGGFRLFRRGLDFSARSA